MALGRSVWPRCDPIFDSSRRFMSWIQSVMGRRMNNEMNFTNDARDRAIRLRPALILLRDAYRYSEKTGKGIWEFATELEELQHAGLTNADLRWLVTGQFVLHGEEVSLPSQERRTFRQCKNLSFGPRTCFVLSAKGLQWISGGAPIPTNSDASINGTHKLNCSHGGHAAQINGEIVQNNGSHVVSDQQGEVPEWDNDQRILKFDDVVVKRFRWPAANQELIVKAFEEQGWPKCIEDPLPRSETVNPKTRLHDTIKCLNRNQINGVIRFHGNGDGTGVIWRRTNEKKVPR